MSSSRSLLAFFSLMAVGLGIALGANAFHEGDQVKLTRNEDLLFLDKVFRSAKADEEFTVLAHRPDQKKVFVRGTDKTGRLIALALPDESVTLIPFDPVKVQSECLRLATTGRFDDALQVLDRAGRSATADPSLAAIRGAVLQLKSASLSAAKANDVQRSAITDASRMRKNAALIDHPNRLAPNDSSNHERAEKLKSDADALQKQAVDAAVEAQKALVAAKQSFADLAVSTQRVAVGPDVKSSPAEMPAKKGIVVGPGQEVGASGLHSKVSVDDALRQAQKDPSAPDDFVSLLAKDPHDFPLTAFASAMKAKDWHAAEGIMANQANELNRRIARFDKGLGFAPLLYLVAAEEPRDSATDAAALILCSKATLIADRALANRILTEYALKNGRLGTAKLASYSIDDIVEKLPYSDKRKLAEGNTDGLSDGALSTKVQQNIVRRLLVTALARAGHNKEALQVGDIDDFSDRLMASCELLKGFVLAGDPYADEFASKLYQALKKVGKDAFRIDVLSAYASALVQRKQPDQALERLEQALLLSESSPGGMSPDSLTSAEFRLLRAKAAILRSVGRKSSADEAVQGALERIEATKNSSEAVEFLAADQLRAKDAIAKIRASWMNSVDEEGIEQFVILSEEQRRADDLPGALETLQLAAHLLPRCKRLELEAQTLGQEQARSADFAGATRTLQSLKRPEDRERVLRLMMVEQAKRGQLKESITSAQTIGATVEMVDEIGAALSGVFEKIVLFPYLGR